MIKARLGLAKTIEKSYGVDENRMRSEERKEMYGEFLKKTEEFIFAEDLPEKADIIFVPGNGYPQMAERAALLYKEGYAPYVLPSGRYSISAGEFSGVLSKTECYQGSYKTEWEFLADVLECNGVPKEAILKEDQATFTYENALLSKKVTEQEGICVRKAILCCKTYHARRALMYYQKVFPDTKFFVCPSCPDGIDRSNWNSTEEGVLAVTGEMTRIIRQFSLMMKDS